MTLTPQDYPRSNLTVPIESPWVLHISVPGVKPRICHRFQDISNQRIVTLTFTFSRSSKVKPMGILYNLCWVQHCNSRRFWHILRHKVWPWFLILQGHPRSLWWCQSKAHRHFPIWPVLSPTPYLSPFGHKSHASQTNEPPTQPTNQPTCVAIGPVCNSCSLDQIIIIISNCSIERGKTAKSFHKDTATAESFEIVGDLLAL